MSCVETLNLGGEAEGPDKYAAYGFQLALLAPKAPPDPFFQTCLHPPRFSAEKHQP